MYVREALKIDPSCTLSTEGFLEYSNTKSDNNNFSYLLNQISIYAQGIINFRMSMRRSNSNLAHPAIYKISPLFYGRNHPFYQRIELHYMVQMFLQLPQVKFLIDRNFTISLCNGRSRGEDWDFILEGNNKIIKYQNVQAEMSIGLRRAGIA